MALQALQRDIQTCCTSRMVGQEVAVLSTP
jgi:hypothetical protein